MTRDFEKVKIFHVSKSEYVEAYLFDGISEKNIKDHENKWVPQLEAANENSSHQGKPQVAEDAHWRWSRKIDRSANQAACRHYAVEYEDYTLGLISMILVGKRSRIEPPKDLVYIDYISVCPEARKDLTNPPHYKGVGKILFMSAVLTSIDEGMEGRIGLVSLPKAQPWYRDILGMKSLGMDPDIPPLEYFELTSGHAKILVDEM